MFSPDKSKSYLCIDSGYHHYIDTGLCNLGDECKNIHINGATVRLIRFGSSHARVSASRLYNVTITVDKGELWHLNTSYEIDSFAGALTVIFNNGTYQKFISDYSHSKITPQEGKYFIISPKLRGMKIVATDTPGVFMVSGTKCAYTVSSDGKEVYYSVLSTLRLPQGTYNINYCNNFSTSLLPTPDDGMEWLDNGFGVAKLVKKKEHIFYVSQKDTEGFFSSLDDAVKALNNSDGTIRICGNITYDIKTKHGGSITIEGNDKNSKLVFPNNRFHYAHCNMLFKNIELVYPTPYDKLMIHSNGYTLAYGENVRSLTGILSGLEKSTDVSESIVINKVFVYSRNIPETLATKKTVMLFCNEGKGEVTCDGTTYTIVKGNALILPKSDDIKLKFIKTKNHKSVLLVVDFTAKKDINASKPKLIQSVAEGFYGEIISNVFSDTSIINDKTWLSELSYAVEQIASTNTAKHALVKRLSEYITQNYASINSVEEIAREFHLNRSYLERAYKKTTGQGLKKELTRVKCDAAKVLMKKGYSIKEAANAVGYENQSTFSVAFKNAMGITPTRFSRYVNN